MHGARRSARARPLDQLLQWPGASAAHARVAGMRLRVHVCQVAPRARLLHDGPCPYRTLGVRFGASSNELKVAHRKLVKDTHPDMNAIKCEATLLRFTQVQSAYELLTDETRRYEYHQSSSRTKGRAQASSSSSSSGSRPRPRPSARRKKEFTEVDVANEKMAKLKDFSRGPLAGLYKDNNYDSEWELEPEPTLRRTVATNNAVQNGWLTRTANRARLRNGMGPAGRRRGLCMLVEPRRVDGPESTALTMLP